MGLNMSYVTIVSLSFGQVIKLSWPG